VIHTTAQAICRGRAAPTTRMSARKRLILAAVIIIGWWPWVVAAQGIANYGPVTDQRLGNPSTPYWLMYRGTYDGWGFHPADLINTTNVKNLVPLWRFSTGDLLWRYRRALPNDILPSHPTNRGVGLYEDKVYLTTLDAHLVALDAKHGHVVWDKSIDDYTQGYYMTLALLVAKGKVLVGVSGGEYGIRGYIAAFDAHTGDQVWKTYTIPGPGEPGHDTWSGESWSTGGVSAWLTGHYDPFLNAAYWGTGNASPWPAEAHPGDNLHAKSVLALDVDTGKLQAWDLKTMQKAWTQTFQSPTWGSVLTTASGLVFMGGTTDQSFRAFDAKTGEVLWEFRTNSGVTGVPISYGRIGVQYIAVQSGWGAEAQAMRTQIDAALGTKTDVPPGGVLWVFGLPE
jgi:glucose dehydrogenase